MSSEPTVRRRSGFDPDELAALESERDFLLRSIADLEAEREAGNLETARYEELRDDYTARAAAVLRSLEAGVDARPVPPPIPWRRKVVVALGLGGFAVVTAVLLAGALGERLPGQTVTGNAQSATSDPGAELRRRVEERPDDPAAHLAYARFLLDSKPAEAVREFDAAARLSPGNSRVAAEAQAYAGWVVFLAARSDRSDTGASGELIGSALQRLDAAVIADPGYPDAHFFRGMVLFRGRNDAAGAVPEFERYLALAPDSPLAPQVKTLLEAARQSQGGG